MLNLWGDKERLAEFWQRLPPPVDGHEVSAQEGAEVWADALPPMVANHPGW